MLRIDGKIPKLFSPRVEITTWANLKLFCIALNVLSFSIRSYLSPWFVSKSTRLHTKKKKEMFPRFDNVQEQYVIFEIRNPCISYNYWPKKNSAFWRDVKYSLSFAHIFLLFSKLVSKYNTSESPRFMSDTLRLSFFKWQRWIWSKIGSFWYSLIFF